ncbi:MAG: MerR family transcriptional regulator [Butyricicoccus sp.]|nr:MerR family transcriptional regulator [Butyricicoccus sp.]
MSGPELFQIGEVAKLFHVSVGTLRHYEQAGLLKPEYIDQNTGYRYYSSRQFEILNTICYLRVLDMPLNQIGDFLRNKDTDIIEEKLRSQKETITQKRRELERIERKIDNRLRQLSEARGVELGRVQIKEMPACRIVGMRDSLKPQNYLDLEQPIRKLAAGQKTPVVFLGKVGLGIAPENLTAGRFDRYDMIFLILDDEDDHDGKAELCPAGRCVSLSFRGSHTEAQEHYKQLMAYIRAQGLRINGFSREVTLIDYGITDDPSKFVTEIRIPIVMQSNS